MLKNKPSKLIGCVYGMLKCVDVYREGNVYYATVECLVCGEKSVIPRNSWNHTKNCPICKGQYAKPKTYNRRPETRRMYSECVDNNTGNYRRYYSIRERAKEVDGAIWHGWTSWKLFEQWCKDNGITAETHRMKISKDATNFGPYSVEFRPKTRNNKNEPEIER